MEPQTGGLDRPVGRLGWLDRMWLAVAFAGRRDVWPVALAGFLVRGGIVVLILPIVVLPTPLGLAAIGLNALTIAADPTTWLIAIIVISTLVGSIWLAVALVFGSAVDAWLVAAARGDDARALYRSATLPPRPVLLRLAAIRLVCLVPLAVALAVAGQRLSTAAYDELTLPTNLTTPLVIRIVEAAGDAVTLVALTWLVAERIAAMAVRRLLLQSADSRPSVWRALGGALAEAGRWPVTTVLTAGACVLGSIVVIGLPLLASYEAFDLARIAARQGEVASIPLPGTTLGVPLGLPMLTAAAIALSVAWLLALLASGATAAWRSAAFTFEVEAALVHRTASQPVEDLGLSTAAEEASGD